MADEKEKIDAQATTDGLDPSVSDAQSTALDQAAELQSCETAEGKRKKELDLLPPASGRTRKF
jgi:hypothetical protein